MKIELLSQYGQRAFASNGGQRQSFPKPLMNAQAFFVSALVSRQHW
ncbi:hypothetical protein AB4Y38_42095 [Paraburkholderia sp. EG285A]